MDIVQLLSIPLKLDSSRRVDFQYLVRHACANAAYDARTFNRLIFNFQAVRQTENEILGFYEQTGNVCSKEFRFVILLAKSVKM